MAKQPVERTLRKVTVMLPQELVASATAATGRGITPTIRLGLERVAASHAFEELRRIRGTVKISLDTDELREDRD
jgi:hypothetical protein